MKVFVLMEHEHYASSCILNIYYSFCMAVEALEKKVENTSFKKVNEACYDNGFTGLEIEEHEII